MLFFLQKESGRNTEVDEWKRMKDCMTDAGCSAAAVQRAEGLFQSGKTEDLIHCLRSCRSNVLEEIHEKQKTLDRLDMLIRDARNR